MTLASSGVTRAATLVDLLRWRAEEQPEREAFTFLVDGETEEVTLTYGELDRRARAIAAQLQERTVTGDRALILCPPGLDYVAAFYGALYAGLAGIPSYIPNRDQGADTLGRVILDAGATAALTTRAASAQLPTGMRALQSLHWIRVDELQSAGEHRWRAPNIAGTSLASLMYTSGSTSVPKGVMVSHAGLMTSLEISREGRLLTPDDRALVWTPLHFAMGLVQVLLVLMSGGSVTVLPAAAVLERPLRWLQAISRQRATMSGAPNFSYDLCARTVSPEDLTTLDLHTWRIATIAGEHVRSDVLDRFASVFGPCGFRREAFTPGYGQTEGTNVAGKRADGPIFRAFRLDSLQQGLIRETELGDPSARTLLGHHPASSRQQLLIVDPETREVCKADRIGEIWVAGPNVALGYWNQPEETEKTFRAHLATGEGPYLRTGDLGFLWEGELFITGRLKELIIIRGRNLYPQDIERTVQSSHPGLVPNGGAAFSVEAGGEERLVIVQEVAPETESLDKMVAAIRRAVTEQHQIQVYAVVLIPAGTLPRTGSGKIQRTGSRQAYQAGTLPVLTDSVLAGRERPALLTPYAPAETATQAALVGIWEAVLGISGIGIHDHFAELGGDSLLSMQVLSRCNEAGLGLTPDHLAQHATIAELAAVAGTAPRIHADQGIVSGPLPLTPPQYRLLERKPDRFREDIVTLRVDVPEALDMDRARRAMEALVAHHDGLRTRFVSESGEWHAHIVPREEHDLVRHVDVDAPADTEQRNGLKTAMAQLRSGIDLENGPVVQAGLVRPGAGRSPYLLVSTHHLVTDAYSSTILVDDLERVVEQLTTSEPLSLPRKTTSYRTWAERLTEFARSGEARAELDYWLSLREHQPAPLPSDSTGNTQQVGSYGLIFRSLTADDTETLLDTAGRLHQVQVIDILLAGVTRGFTAWTGSPSLLVELSSHGRAPLFPDIEVSRTVGWFQAVYPVLLRPSDTPLSSAPVSAMSRMLGEVPSHGVGYGALRYLSPDPDVRHQLECLPRAQVTFNYVGAYHEGALGGGDEDQERSRVSKRQVQAYDYIQVVATVRKRQLRLRFRYHENVYRRETIERVAEDVRDTVRALITALQSSGSTGSPETTVPIPIDRESR